MNYLSLRKKIAGNLINFLDVAKIFPKENIQTIRIQLARFVKRGWIKQIKRGLYCFEPNFLDELELASIIYRPSYISLETALNYYGIIPDIPQAVTSVCLTTTKKIKTEYGNYYYAKIKQSLFFGYLAVESPTSKTFFNLARKEKALLDYFYLRKISKTSDLRLDLQDFDFKLFKKYIQFFPNWVQRVKL